jgi:tetratricopeptide (TPR) repeat protein
MKKITLFLLVFSAVSCIQNPKLTEAELLFETDYDSACAVLCKIEPERLISRKDKAIYALSLTRAKFYQGKSDSGDSLINIAIDYFDNRDPHRASLAWFYKAKTDAMNQNFDQQIVSLFNAQDYTLKSGNDKLLTYIFLDRATLFQNQGKNDSALVNFKNALKNFKLQGEDLNALYVETQLASLYIILKQYDEAEKICLTMLKNEDKMPAEYSSTFYRTLGSVYYQQRDYTRSVQVLKKTPLTQDKVFNDNLSLLIANSYFANSQFDSARIYLEGISHYDRMATDYHKLWKKLYVSDGNYPKAIESMESVIASMDSTYKNRIDESFEGLEKKYNYQKLQIQNKDLELKNVRSKLMVLLSIIVIASIIIVFIFYRNKSRLKQIKSERELLKQKTLQAQKEIENAKLIENQMVLQKIVITNLEQYRANATKKNEHIRVGFSPVKNEHFYHELLTAVDLQYNNFSKRILKKFSQLNETDILICCLILAGFDTGMMAAVLNIKFESMNVKRSRLRKKLKLDISENFLNYLRTF